MPENYYDKASRFLAKLEPVAFLSWLLRLPTSSFVFRGWLDTRGVPFPGDADRVSDTVAHVENVGENGVPWVIAVEFQTKPDPEMFGRLMGYLSGLWLERKGWNVDESEYVNEWMDRGQVREAQQLILRIGAKKLGPAPAGIESVLRAIQDRDRLERIADRLFEAPGWGDLVATV